MQTLQLLHRTGNGIFGISPICTGIAVIEFGNEPIKIPLDSGEIFFHQSGNGIIKPSVLPVGQVVGGHFQKLLEMPQAKALGIFHFFAEFRILQHPAARAGVQLD